MEEVKERGFPSLVMFYLSSSFLFFFYLCVCVCVYVSSFFRMCRKRQVKGAGMEAWNPTHNTFYISKENRKEIQARPLTFFCLFSFFFFILASFVLLLFSFIATGLDVMASHLWGQD